MRLSARVELPRQCSVPRPDQRDKRGNEVLLVRLEHHFAATSPDPCFHARGIDEEL